MIDLQMQAKAIAAQARRMDKEISDCMKKITFVCVLGSLHL